jgi:hypothetical protein
MSRPQDRVIAHVTTLAAGGPADPSWRVTLHFHPGRLVAGRPILRLIDEQALKRVWHYLARFGSPEMTAPTRS